VRSAMQHQLQTVAGFITVLGAGTSGYVIIDNLKHFWTTNVV
jgi:hypothetical protein